jgi:hypothetical protein
MIVNIGGIDHEIETVVHHKQCDNYYKAINENNGANAHMYFRPPTYINPHLIQSKIQRLRLIADYNDQIKRIDEMDPEMLKIEMELQYGCKTQEPKRKSIFNIFKF